MHRTPTIVAIALTGLFASTTVQAGGTTHNVRVNGDIQAAIIGASNGDTIQLAAGQYDITTTIDPGGKQVTILGTVDGNGDPTSILDAGDNYRVLICQSGETSTTVFENLVIRNGLATGSFPGNGGGGMYNDHSSPTLTNCTFTGNSGIYCGGMYNYDGSSPTLTNCTFTNNSASGDDGGGMANEDASSPTLTNCTFTSNSSSDDGGGMSNANNSNPTLTDCTFTSNSTNDGGGGMFNVGSNPTLTNCTFTGNWAKGGGGMANVGSSPTLEGCMFSGNSARGTGKSGIGGGMVNLDSAPTLTDCTLTENSADLNGGAIFNLDMNTNTVTLTDCNFCGNNDGSGFNSISGGGIDGSSSGNNLRDAACVFGDINFDGVANLADRTSLNTLIGVCDADINGDGEVNGADMAFILSWWGVCSP